MSELGGLRSTLHVVRTVRRAEYLGKEAGGGIATGNIDPLAVSASALSVATTALAFGPEAAAVMAVVTGTLIGVNAVSQYIVDGQLILPNPQAGIAVSDQMRKAILTHVYGADLGDKLWQLEFGTRQTEIDLRAKWPG